MGGGVGDLGRGVGGLGRGGWFGGCGVSEGWVGRLGFRLVS